MGNYSSFYRQCLLSSKTIPRTATVILIHNKPLSSIKGLFKIRVLALSFFLSASASVATFFSFYQPLHRSHIFCFLCSLFSIGYPYFDSFFCFLGFEFLAHSSSWQPLLQGNGFQDFICAYSEEILSAWAFSFTKSPWRCAPMLLDYIFLSNPLRNWFLSFNIEWDFWKINIMKILVLRMCFYKILSYIKCMHMAYT